MSENSRKIGFDELTGLLNRRVALAIGERWWTESEDPSFQVGLFLCNLDKFKLLNHLLGHRVGDEVLVEAASRLTSAARENDVVSRLGKDEFLILRPNIHTFDQMDDLITRILRSFESPIHILGHALTMRNELSPHFSDNELSPQFSDPVVDEHAVRVKISIGFVIWNSLETLSETFAHAGMALDQAKIEGEAQARGFGAN